MSSPVLRTGGVTPLNCTSMEKPSVRRYSPVRKVESIGRLSMPVPEKGLPVGIVKPVLK